jgi:hypothetical protein
MWAFMKLILGLLLIASSTGANAATFLNSNFENGNLSGCSTSGDVAVISSPTLNASRISGAYSAALTTSSKSNQDDFPLATGILNLSGSEPAGSGSSKGLNEFLGISQTALDIDLFTQSTEGSAIQQTISLLAGSTVNFKWQFLSADSWLGDYAFVAINGVVTKLADIGYSPSLTSLTGPLTFATGVNTFTYNAASAGNYTFGLGVVDILDFTGTSMLVVDEFQVSAIPEPEHYTMLLAGLGSVFLIARRRRNL